MKKEKRIKNRNGIIKVGDEVIFKVENQDIWVGDTTGILDFIDGEFVIRTKRSGILTIDKGYDVYFNTIKKLI